MEVGLYGKLPSHGDFLRRRVSDAFVGAWDSWLQQSVAASHEALAERWLDIYLTSPVWRFAVAPGVLGHGPVAGVMTPSVDRVGRYFPLAVVTEGPWDLPAPPGPLSLAVRGARWFDEVDRLLLETVGADVPDFDHFDDRVARSAALLEPLTRPEPVAFGGDDARAAAEDGGGWWLPLASADSLATLAVQLAGARLEALNEPLMLWWTDGSTLVAPCCLVTRGLPDPHSFASFLDGDWRRATDLRIARAELAPNDAATETLADESGSVSYQSAARSDRGPVRAVNQDACLERPEIGCWVVADGMGGHEHGEVASRMVCDALASLAPGPTLEATAGEVRRSLAAVNAALRRGATGGTSGSTVVALLTRGWQWQVLWAGDSRLYRLRGGALEPMTTDHSWRVPGTPAEDEDAYAISRAVGGEDVLELEAHRGRVQRGDRFLLCSDGLTRVLDEPALAALVGHGTPAEAADALIAAALAAKTTDNVTVVVVAAD